MISNYENIRDLIFNYLLEAKNLNTINNEINRLERNIPYENSEASEYIMDKIDIIIIKRDKLINKMNKMKEEIDSILKVSLKN